MNELCKWTDSKQPLHFLPQVGRLGSDDRMSTEVSGVENDVCSIPDYFPATNADCAYGLSIAELERDEFDGKSRHWASPQPGELGTRKLHIGTRVMRTLEGVSTYIACGGTNVRDTA